jgi:hypothetical protein
MIRVTPAASLAGTAHLLCCNLVANPTHRIRNVPSHRRWGVGTVYAWGAAAAQGAGVLAIPYDLAALEAADKERLPQPR